MNTVSRGIRNAFRNVIRTGSIVIIHDLDIAGRTDKTFTLSDGRLAKNRA